jgi:hypothetical protein
MNNLILNFRVKILILFFIKLILRDKKIIFIILYKFN